MSTDTATARETTIAEDHDVFAFVAMDTIEALADRLVKVVGTGRRMTVVRKYLGSDLDRAAIKTSLTLDPDDEIHPGGVKRWEQRNPHGRGVHFYLTRVEGFGIGAFAHENPTEREARQRHASLGSGHLTSATYIQIRGRGEGREDSILIQSWNSNAVCTETLIAFEVPR